jgi:hypothetical protein
MIIAALLIGGLVVVMLIRGPMVIPVVSIAVTTASHNTP